MVVFGGLDEFESTSSRVRVRELDAPVGPGGKPPELGTLYNVLTIPGYFAVNMVNSVGVLLDVQNWGNNYNMIVEKDFNRNKPKPSE